MGAGLTCASYSYCSDYTVATYGGQTIPSPAGGTIADGLYRLAYQLQSSGTGVNDDGPIADAYLFKAGEYLDLQNIYSSTGTFATTAASMPTVTFTPTVDCNTSTGAAEPSDSGPPQPFSNPYSVDAKGNLYLFPPNLSNVNVYIQVQSLCAEPASVPPTPGDSLNCMVNNCGCSESSNSPADPNTCKMFQ